eukprot:UN11080
MSELRKEVVKQGSDRIKTDEEQAREKREQLEELEKQRLQRQYGVEVGDLNGTNWDALEEGTEKKAEVAKETNQQKYKKNGLKKLRDEYSDVGFLIDVPDSFEEFVGLMKKKTPKQQLVVIQRIRTT